MRVRSLVITPAMEGTRVRALLKRELLLSDALISRLKRRERGICLNGEKCYTNVYPKAGDVLSAEVGDERPHRPRPWAVPLPVVWQDEDMLVLDKPGDLAVHVSLREEQCASVEGALAMLLPPGDGIHPVSRLDKGTTGLMTVAKSGYMHDILRRMLHTPDFRREYIGICLGQPPEREGHIRLPIGRLPGYTYARRVDPGGAASHTEYRLLAAGGGMSLLRLIPHTGRTHQLRVHMAAVGCPLAGDWMYGREDPGLISRPALHSAELWLRHPLTGERLHLVAPIPEDMRGLLRRVLAGG